MNAHLLALITSVGAFMALPIPCVADGPNYEVRCKERLPEFTLGPNSHPSQDQESALCACIWSDLDQPDRIISQGIRERSLTDGSAPGMQAFIGRFGDAIEKCGGLKL